MSSDRGRHEPISDGALRRPDRRSAVLLRPHRDHRDTAWHLLRGRDDPVSPCRRDPHLRLPPVRIAAARACSRARSLACRGSRREHRAHRQEHGSQGIRRRAGAGATWRSSGPGARHLGHGVMRCLSALARQADAQDLRAAGQRQMPALLFLYPDSARIREHPLPTGFEAILLLP
jgi:hypothetical protein